VLQGKKKRDFRVTMRPGASELVGFETPRAGGIRKARKRGGAERKPQGRGEGTLTLEISIEETSLILFREEEWGLGGIGLVCGNLKKKQVFFTQSQGKGMWNGTAFKVNMGTDKRGDRKIGADTSSYPRAMRRYQKENSVGALVEVSREGRGLAGYQQINFLVKKKEDAIRKRGTRRQIL